MAKSPAFQFYPADFLADENVVLMTNQEVGCYVKLMCYCWREGSIPTDVKKIARLCGENESAMAELWPNLKPCFKEKDGRFYHPRLDKEREKQQNFKKNRVEAGKKGAAIRWADKGLDGTAIDEPMAQPMAKNASSSSSLSFTTTSNNNNTESEIKIPLRDGSEFSVAGVLLSEFQEAYPGIDVPAELHKARAWNIANPSKQKTKRGVKKHLNTWMSNAESRASQDNTSDNPSFLRLNHA